MSYRQCFAVLALIGLCVPLWADDRPNLVFMIADDCTYLDMQVYGGQAKTPNLNRLAAQGMQFSRCFQTAPMCSPTRHNIYTGIYPVKSGAWPNHTRVYPGTKSIAHYLRDAGYRVALSGKTHIAPKASFPFEYSGEFRSSEPPEELYDVATDPHCLVNLVDDSRYAKLKAELSEELDKWMASQGDQGAATEAVAHTRKAGYKENKRPAR
jgi:uncharacterized sulfatase